jgi:hypothetical protein
MILSLYLTIALINHLISAVHHIAGSIYSHIAYRPYLLVLQYQTA